MIREFASDHADVFVSILVFGVTFILFIFWLIWSNIVSKNYIKHCEEMTKNEE